MSHFYLASKSPRRRQLLQQVGYEFEICDSEINEVVMPGESPEEAVTRLAEQKVHAAWDVLSTGQSVSAFSSKPVLASDTIVSLNGAILGKPSDINQARSMLGQLANKSHIVLTAVSVKSSNRVKTILSKSYVEFGEIDKNLLEDYLATGDSLDKAGAYGIQGYAARFIKKIDGSFSGVMGLPLFETCRLLDEFIHD